MTPVINPMVAAMQPFIVMEVLERAQQLQNEGIDIIHLEVGEPDFDMPQCVVDASHLAIDSGLSHYSHSMGMPELRQTISWFYKKEYNVTVDPECVLVTAGSSPAILMALLALCEAGSEVIVTNPGYPCYRNFIMACNAKAVEVNVSAGDNFHYRVGSLEPYINNRTRAIFVNSPMNPCGTLAGDELFRYLAKLNVPVISDEIYHGLTYGQRAKSILEFTDKAFVISGFSKRFAMTGLRLGYIIAPKEYVRSLQILQQNLFICAPSAAQYAGIAALKETDADVKQMCDTYNERRLYMIDRLKQMGFGIEAEPEGAFYVFANARRFTSNAYQFAFEALEQAHVGITPGVDFGTQGEGYVRFSYANSLENIKTGLDRLERWLKRR
jgi:aspartate/methionine/tyrosine aminotransferase